MITLPPEAAMRSSDASSPIPIVVKALSLVDCELNARARTDRNCPKSNYVKMLIQVISPDSREQITADIETYSGFIEINAKINAKEGHCTP